MKSIQVNFIATLLIVQFGLFARSSEDAPKGVLPEIRMNSGSEEQNQLKAMETEVMITKTENEAIASLKTIIAKRKGQPEEASLWNRLAELYMRRAKSGRFFDLFRESDSAAKFVAPAIRGQSASQYLKEAIGIYDKIEKQWVKFEDMDAVLFNCAFASQQLGQNAKAEQKYSKLIKEYPDSLLIPDAELALGEMNYDAQHFTIALEHFQIIEKYPKSRVYSYGLYKAAWALYNLKQNQKAIDQLIKVVHYFDPRNSVTDVKVNHNLRIEAIRDLGLFFGDVYTPEKAYGFFADFCSVDELGDAMLSLTHLYQSHSRDKEIAVFLPDFIAHQPMHPSRINAELALCDSLENIKARNKVVEHLEQASQLCEMDSQYRQENKKTVEQSCDIDFPRSNIEFAKKWWDIWQKNQKNVDIVKLTVKAFEIHLRHDDPKKPDVKSRYAYAELLYQMADYKNASAQYEKVSDKAVDSVVLHDSSYSALVSAEKASIKGNLLDQQNLIRLSQKYLDKNPTGTNVAQVKFKIGFIYYEMTKLNEAETWLKPLALTATNDKKVLEFKRKAEDLELDILNARKDYPQIVTLSTQLLTEKIDAQRKTDLTKILEEAKFANVQSELAKSKDDGEKWKISQGLYQFSKDHPQSPLAKDALWQSLSLAFTTGHPVDAADWSLQFIQLYPKEAKNKQALKEAAKTYADNGLFTSAASTLQVLADMSEGKEKIQFIEATAEVYALMGKDELARKEYSRLLSDKSKDNQSKVYSQIIATFKGKENSQEYHEVENKILSAGVEPYYSLMQAKLSENLVNQRRWVEAFNSTKNLINSNASAEAKARAHLVRGRVLEQELIDQSLKTSLERLSTVLAYKTEKLDKAQQAYSLAEKLAEKPETQMHALMGLSRCYQNYISSVASPTLKNELKPEELTALQGELNKILKPITERLADIQKRISAASVAESKLGSQGDNEYLSTPSSETIKPTGKLSSHFQIGVYLPEELVTDGSKWNRFEISKKDTCTADLSKNPAELEKMANVCVIKSNWTNVQKIAEQLVRINVQSPSGLFFMAVSASENKLSNKALWLYGLALKKDPSNPVLHFNKARELLHDDQTGPAMLEFKAITDKHFVTSELQLVSALQDYASGDCLTAEEHLRKLDRSEIRSFNAVPVLAECTSVKGETDDAIRILKKDLKEKANQPDLWMELARLQEVFKFEKQEALSAYQSASQYSNNEDLKNWIRRKVEYLNGKVSVTVLNPQHVGAKDRDSGTVGGP